MIASPIRKFLPLVRQAESSGVKVFKLNVGDPDIQVPKEILRALKGYSDKNIHYAPSRGIREHVEGWIKYYAGYGISLEAENIIPTVGGAEAILMALMAVTNPGDEVLVFEPLYASYRGYAALLNIKLVPLSLELENNFVLAGPETILDKMTEKTKAMVVINPDNPTGKVWKKQELEILIKLAKKYGLFIIADETYREIVFSGQPGSLLQERRIRQNLMVVDSLSKRFCAPGIRIGAVVSYNRELMGLMLKMAMVRLSVPTLGQLSTIAILKNSQPFTTKLRDEFRRRRDTVNRALARIPGIVTHEPAGAFYQVVGLPLENAEDFIKFMLTKFRFKGQTLLVTPMEDFYLTRGRGRNEIRMAYVLKVRELRVAMNIFKKGLEKYE